jgi:hypothetical protein
MEKWRMLEARILRVKSILDDISCFSSIANSFATVKWIMDSTINIDHPILAPVGNCSLEHLQLLISAANMIFRPLNQPVH